MRAQRRDRNEGPIRAHAEALGFLWLENNASTKGRPDACLLRSGETYWCEVKVPDESYTPAQMDTFAAMAQVGVPVYVLEAPDDVVRLLHGNLGRWSAAAVSVVRDAKGRQKTKREHRPGYDRARTVAEFCTWACCGISRAPGGTKCFAHGATSSGELATMENGLLPAPRKGVSERRAKVTG